MTREAATPACPSCARAFTWKDSSTFWNPWNVPGPYCGAALEASRNQKIIAAAVVPGGVLLATTVLWIEKLGAWQQRALVGLLVFVAVSLFAGALLSWRHTSFTIKSGG